MVKRSLESREFAREDGYVWVVEQLARPYKPHASVPVSSDFRVVRIDGAGSRHIPKPTPLTRKARTDFRVWVPPLDNTKQVLLHRVAAYAFKTDGYETEGGGLVPWQERPAWGAVGHLQVDHGDRGAKVLRVGSLRWCTGERNRELEVEREATRRESRRRATATCRASKKAR